ncbi:MAG: hypothetical protein IJH64_04190 [Oscillospiraceae bacterium]|nr:hypothetical protein [Oscillospiraceae bacterium]MBR0450359.1 hypothetical protein [Oscillospiraceae bacterium]
MKWKKTAFIFVMIIFAAILVACETNNSKPEQITTPLEQEITTADPPSEIDNQSGEQRLFPYNGEQLCVFERSTTSDVGLYTKENFSSLLLFDYRTETYSKIDLPDYKYYSGINPSAPVLWNSKILTVECRALRNNSYEQFIDDAPSKLFIIDLQTGNTKVVETDQQYYLFGSPIWGIPGDVTHILITGSKGQNQDTLLLRVDISNGTVEDLGVYKDTERKKPVNGLPFDMYWQDSDGFTYGYRGSDNIDAQALYRKETASSGDYSLLIEDCYPNDYYNPYSGGFRVLKNTAYYYGVSNTLESPMIFSYDLNSGKILQRAKDMGESRMPVDQYGTKLIVAVPEAIRNGVPHSPDDIGIIDEKDFMISESKAQNFTKNNLDRNNEGTFWLVPIDNKHASVHYYCDRKEFQLDLVGGENSLSLSNPDWWELYRFGDTLIAICTLNGAPHDQFVAIDVPNRTAEKITLDSVAISGDSIPFMDGNTVYFVSNRGLISVDLSSKEIRTISSAIFPYYKYISERNRIAAFYNYRHKCIYYYDFESDNIEKKTLADNVPLVFIGDSMIIQKEDNRYIAIDVFSGEESDSYTFSDTSLSDFKAADEIWYYAVYPWFCVRTKSSSGVKSYCINIMDGRETLINGQIKKDLGGCFLLSDLSFVQYE